LANEYLYVQGKLSWVKCDKPDEWGKWKATIHPTPASLEKIRDLQAEGLKNVLKKDEDGYYVSFSRPTQKLIRGKVVGLTPPPIIGEDGAPFTKAIGNGSGGILKLEVYQHNTPGGGKAKAARLESVKITDHIPFEREKDFDPKMLKETAGLDDQKEELW